MAYHVSLTAPAETDAYAAFERIREAAPVYAEKWLVRLFKAIATLEEMPSRCPVIPEAAELGFTARHLLFGRGHGVYRIIFDIQEDERHVRVLRVWHGFWDAITAARRVGFLGTSARGCYLGRDFLADLFDVGGQLIHRSKADAFAPVKLAEGVFGGGAQPFELGTVYGFLTL